MTTNLNNFLMSASSGGGYLDPSSLAGWDGVFRRSGQGGLVTAAPGKRLAILGAALASYKSNDSTMFTYRVTINGGAPMAIAIYVDFRYTFASHIDIPGVGMLLDSYQITDATPSSVNDNCYFYYIIVDA